MICAEILCIYCVHVHVCQREIECGKHLHLFSEDKENEKLAQRTLPPLWRIQPKRNSASECVCVYLNTAKTIDAD